MFLTAIWLTGLACYIGTMDTCILSSYACILSLYLAYKFLWTICIVQLSGNHAKIVTIAARKSAKVLLLKDKLSSRLK